MKRRIILLSLFLISSVISTLKAQENYKIDWEYRELPFSEFVNKAESRLNIRFLYKDEWVKDLKMGYYPDCSYLTCILDNLFRNTSLHYFIDDSGNMLITKDLILNDTIRAVIRKTSSDLPVELEPVINISQNEKNLYVEIGNRNENNNPGNATVSGFVTNTETGKPAPGVSVFIKSLSTGILTNENGFYTLTLPKGFHEIQFSFIGLQEKKISMNLFGSGRLNVDMPRSVINLNEVIVSAQKNELLERSEVGLEKINIKSFRLLPTSMGESDIIKSINLIPGVQSVGEGSAGFNVRGGSADQNLILLYGAPVYNSSHFFGFFSSVNSDIIKDVILYKGGIPSRFGGRISSVLDIDTKAGNSSKQSGNIGISPVMTHIMVEGPLIRDTVSYILTARTTYSNWVSRLVKSPILHNSRASFYDLNGKISYSFDQKNKFDLSAYFSSDYFSLNYNTVYSYYNSIIALKWLHSYKNNISSVFSFSNSNYNYDIVNQDLETEAYSLSHKINSTQFKADYNWLKGRHKFNFGTDLTWYGVLPGSYRPASDSSTIISNTIERERALETALYIEDKLQISKFLTINAGIRMSAFFALGPQTVLLYTPGFSKNRASVIDSAVYRSGELTAGYSGPELRLSMNFRISDKNSIKLNYNRTRQYLHLLSNSASISPTDTWKLCDYYLKPVIGDQYAFGFYKMLFRNKVETSAEIYYKNMKNMIDFKGGSSLTMIDGIEQYMIDVKGKAYGLELALKKTEGKSLFSVSYTYARTMLKSLSTYRDEIINSGNWYPANYDKPNNLAVTYQYTYSRRLSFSADYNYSTGRPITFPLSTYRVRNIKLMYYSDRNKYRIPDYSRFDVSMKVSGNLRSDKIANPNLTFSVYNVFGKENAYSVYFIKEGEVVQGYKLSVFGRAIPTVTFNFDF